MAHLALFLFGLPRMERDSVILNVDTRKAVALIAYLAVTQQRHSRDTLATLFWPDSDQSHARATLRRTLSALNKALDGPWMNSDRESIKLNRSNFWSDIDEFHEQLTLCKSHGHASSETCSACIGPLTRAAEIYNNDFLAGFTLNDSSKFEEWQFFQADSLRRNLVSALERLVHLHSTLAHFEIAIGYARRWLALDRLHEPAHRQLMLLYAWSGQRNAALHQYQECGQVLEQELGVEPLEETTQLYNAIKVHQVPALPTQQHIPISAPEKVTYPSTIGAPGSLATSHISQGVYPLVGRSAEWSALVKAYTDGGATGGRIAILEGEAGIGKTRLAEEFISYMHSRGAMTVAARCYEGERHLAYGPIVAALRTAIAQKAGMQWQKHIATYWLSEATRLLPELAPSTLPPPLDSPGAQSHFFEGLIQVLLTLCSEKSRPTGILFFDDIQWADSTSLDLLSYLARRIHEHNVCLLLAWRTSQGNATSRLHHLRTEMQRSSHATLLSLSRLSLPAVKELMQGTVPGNFKPSEGLLERLYTEAEGLPFFLTEYLNALIKGVLTAEEDTWSLPGGVSDLLKSRIADVGGTGEQLLSAAASIGRSFDFDTLREVSGRREEETVAALEELIEQGLVKEIQGSTLSIASADTNALMYDFNHEKLRSLVYEETSLARRRLLHRRIAEVLASRTYSQGGSDALAGRIAYHYQLAGNAAMAADYFRKAGERARDLYAHSEALTHFHSALTLGYPDTALLYEAIGDLHTFLGEYAAALKGYESAAHFSKGQTLAHIEHKLGIVYERRGDWQEAENHFETALHMLGGTASEEELASIYADWSLATFHNGDINKALVLAKHALARAEATHHTHTIAQAHNMLGMIARSQRDLELAGDHLEQSLALTEHLHDPTIRVAVLNNLALVCKERGVMERARVLTEAALTLCISQGDLHREAALHNNLADLLHTMGKREDTMSHLKRAVTIYAEIGVEAGMVQPEIWKLAEW